MSVDFYFHSGWTTSITDDAVARHELDPMAPIIHELKGAIDRTRGGREFFECRHCGTDVEAGTVQCPNCESAEIASYKLS